MPSRCRRTEREDLLHPRRHVRVGVDLAVRVGQRHPDLLAVVLERKTCSTPSIAPRALRSGRPRRRRPGGRARGPSSAKTRSCSSGEADDLAAAEARAQLGQRVARRRGRHVPLDRRWPATGSGSRRRRPGSRSRGSRWAGRAGTGHSGHSSAGGRKVRRLPVGGDGDPLAQQRVAAQLRVGGDRRQVAGVGRRRAATGSPSKYRISRPSARRRLVRITAPTLSPAVIMSGRIGARERREPPTGQAGGSRAL